MDERSPVRFRSPFGLNARLTPKAFQLCSLTTFPKWETLVGASVWRSAPQSSATDWTYDLESEGTSVQLWQ